MSNKATTVIYSGNMTYQVTVTMQIPEHIVELLKAQKNRLLLIKALKLIFPLMSYSDIMSIAVELYGRWHPTE